MMATHQKLAVWTAGKGQHISNLGGVLVLDFLRALQKVHAAAVVDPITELEAVRLAGCVLCWHVHSIGKVQ